ncbi:MAG TPA: extracellular solute-binding protein, partial [Spirochaetia bacterium]|nr:extracellular solute-binding protein [Spirochaetia bacterium]
SAGPATIRFAWWGGDARHKATIAAADAFMKKYPNIKVETEYQGYEGYYNKLMTEVAAGTGPDVFQFITAWYADVRKSPQMFYDLRKLQGLDLSGWNASTLDIMSLDGKLIGTPEGQNARILVYNKDLADGVGVSPGETITWAGFAKMVQDARAKDPSIYGYSGIMDQYYYPLIAYIDQKSGHQFITSDMKFGFSEATLVDALTMFQKWFKDGTFEPLDKTVLMKNAWSDPNWLNGKVLFNETPVTQLGQQMNYKFKVGLTRYWAIDGAQVLGIPAGPNMMFSVSSQTKNPAAVAELLNFIHTAPAGVQAAELQRGVPSNKIGYDILVKANMIDSLTQEAMKITNASGDGNYSFIDPNEIQDALKSAIEKIGLAGGTSPQVAAQEFLTKGEAILKRFQ